MAKAMESLSTLPIGMLTLHAHAGEEALKRCTQTGKDILPETLLLAVTVLTSMDQDALNAIGAIPCHRTSRKTGPSRHPI